MKSPAPRTSARISTWQHLLQVAGAVTIVAFHTEAPFSQAGWVAVELFFVMAGMHMHSALDREQSLAGYAVSRMRRLMPEVAAVWLATLLIVLLGHGSDGMLWFLGSAPFNLQNLTTFFFRFDLPRDAVFGPLWFVAALFQLQLLLFASKRLLHSAKPTHILGAALIAGVGARLAFGVFSGHPRTMDGDHAGILYCMPFCHLEAIVLGFLLGRGDMPSLGKKLPWILGLLLVLGFLNFHFAGGRIKIGSLGFEFPPRTNFSYLWVYPLLALAAASLCAKDGWLATLVDNGRCPGWIVRSSAKLAALSYGVYCFHGLIISTGLNASKHFSNSSFSKSLIFAITLTEAFLLAGIFAILKYQLGQTKTRNASVKGQH